MKFAVAVLAAWVLGAAAVADDCGGGWLCDRDSRPSRLLRELQLEERCDLQTVACEGLTMARLVELVQLGEGLRFVGCDIGLRREMLSKEVLRRDFGDVKTRLLQNDATVLRGQRFVVGA